MTASKVTPQVPIHLSTQANTTNYQSALFWQNLGARRINVARELSLKEIKEIVLRCDLEVEAFVHGAMCISYSGRCLLSSFLANRDGNRGMCTQSCRWKYAVVEELRPNQYMPIAEDDRGSFIFNSRDLCMIEHIPEMVESGIVSFKIEGRMKGINYLASAVKVYREAIDDYSKNPAGYGVKKDWLEELGRISHRSYCTGFYFDDPDQISPAYEGKKNGGLTFIGKITDNIEQHSVNIEVRNKIFKGDVIEVLRRKRPSRQDKINGILDQDGQSISFAQPGSKVTIALNNSYAPNDLIRRAETT